MRRILLLGMVFGAHAFAGPATTLESPRFSVEQQRVITASVARRDAMNRRDIRAAARYVLDDCVFSDDNGSLLSKREYLQHLGRLPAAYDQTADPRDYTVRLHGATAVLNFRVTDIEEFGETRIVNEQRRTETWLKSESGWRLAAVQWGNLPVNFRNAAAADPSKFHDYVGRYEWRPGDSIDEVVAEDGKLWSKMGDAIDEYLSMGGEAFFVKPDLGSVTFVRDAHGLVNGYIYRRSDGQELFARKLD